jgi:hypothetical protein
VETGRLARMGWVISSVISLSLAVAACSNAATPAATVVRTSAVTETPSATPTAGPTVARTAGPTASPIASPRPMAQASVKPGPTLSQARRGQAAVRLHDGRVLILGGTVPFTGKCPMACISPATASVEVWDPSNGRFSAYGSLAAPRTDGSALLLNDGRVLVSGGNGEYGDWLSTIEIYDPAHRTSAAVKLPADLQRLPIYPTVVLLSDGRVLIAGGSYDNLASTSNVTLIFDPTSGAFSNGPLMAEPRQGATATLLHDGRVLITGGDYYEGNYGYAKTNAELIDPSRPLSPSTLVVAQHPATSTLLSDGRVLVAGGGPYDTGSICVTPVASEVFDPGTGKFTPVGPMGTPRTGSAAIKVQDGRVLFFGGLDSNCQAVGTVEAFDPDSGTFQVIATAFPKISGFSVTLLDDGEILVAAGGIDWNMTTASWLLKP